MIVRMKELFLFTTARSVDETVQRLGEFGVVDIKEINRPGSKIFQKRSEAVNKVEKAIAILTDFQNSKTKAVLKPKYTIDDPKQLVDRVIRTTEIRENCKKKLHEFTEQLAFYKTWGAHVALDDIAYLKKKGIYLRLYRAEKSLVQSLAKKHTLVAFPEQKGKVPVALITRSPNEKIKLKEEPIPDVAFDELTQRISRKERQLKEINVFLKDQARTIAYLQSYGLHVRDQLGTQWTLESMGDVEGLLKYLKGYVPKNAIEDFKIVAKHQNWGYAILEPENPQEVPVYIKNPKWISIIDPVMKFIDIVPGYKEVDVSIYFLIAFALFFAMLVGDAGYGAIFLLMAIALRRRIPRQPCMLIYVLSGATIVWGVLSGTYFGSEKIAAIPFINHLIIPDIASFGFDNISFMMHLSFLIGSIHLTVAHVIRFVRFINSIKALSEIGWIALVWGLFLITEHLVLGKAMPGWAPWLFVLGALLVALFSAAHKNFFRSMLVSIANLPLSLISGFSDIVSYVRLFAVGMATAAVAASFNHMILPKGIADMGFIELLLAIVALFLGHVLNIALALMAVMVHGIRLNMLEFAGHLGVQFSGEAYKPFKLSSPDDTLKTGA